MAINSQLETESQVYCTNQCAEKFCVCVCRAGFCVLLNSASLPQTVRRSIDKWIKWGSSQSSDHQPADHGADWNQQSIAGDQSVCIILYTTHRVQCTAPNKMNWPNVPWLQWKPFRSKTLQMRKGWRCVITHLHEEEKEEEKARRRRLGDVE